MARAAFKRADLTRALLAAQAGGFTPDEVRIAPSGEIRLLGRRRGQDEHAHGAEIDDELARFEAKKHAPPTS